MIRDLSRNAAFLNAQAVASLAVMFGHGDTVTVSVNDSAVVLTVTFDAKNYVADREADWLQDRVMAGTNMWSDESFDLSSFDLNVSWEFNPNIR